MNEFSLELASEFTKANNAFPVDLSRAWSWLGYSRKDKAKDFVIKNLIKGVDYILHLQGELGTLDVLRPSEELYITVEAFKMWGMMAGTSQGRVVLDIHPIAALSHLKRLDSLS